MRRRLGLFFASWLVSGAWLGCNLILGNESAVFVPGESGTSDDGSTRDGAVTPDGSQQGDGGLPDGTVDAGPCTNLATNPKHCGSCGHDCLGGQCFGGMCQPVELATDESGPFAIALDGTHVYWNNRDTGTLWRVPKAGGPKERLLEAPMQGLGDEIAVHDGMVYFPYGVGDAGVVRCPVTGCVATGPETVLQTDTPVSGVTIEDGVLLFVEPASGNVGRCPLPCTGAAEIVASGETLPLRAAQAGGVVAWSVISSQVRIKVGDEAPFGIPVNGNFATAVAIADGIVYAQEVNKGPLVIPTDGGPARRLTTSNFGNTEELALDDTSVYFTDKVGQGRVLRCDRSGCPDSGVELATNQAQPRGIAVDDKSVYWVNSALTTAGAVGAVMRVAK